MGAVKNQAAAKQPEFHDDGTPRRKYELNALADGKAIRRITIGFVLANAFLLLKNILFDAGKTEAQAARASRPDAAEGGISEEVALAEETEVRPEDPKEAETGETPAPRTGSGTLFGGQGTLNVNSWAPEGGRFAFVRYELR